MNNLKKIKQQQYLPVDNYYKCSQINAPIQRNRGAELRKEDTHARCLQETFLGSKNASRLKMSTYKKDITCPWIQIESWLTVLTAVNVRSVAQSCPTLCNPLDYSMPGFPIHHQLLEPAQTHAHRVGDAVQPSHPLSSPSPPAPNLSQHQGLFQ